MHKNKIILGGIVLSIVLTAWVILTVQTQKEAEGAIEIQNRRYVAQRTATSIQHQLVGHESHQEVLVLPLREDGRIWTGTITWTASVPVEVGIYHVYDTSINTDKHGKPVTAPLLDGSKTIAFTLIKPDSNTPVPSGSITFTGSALIFHTRDGTPFTVTYTVDAFAK